MTSTTPELVRQQNRAIILATIQEQGPISRVELANLLGLNPATITRIARNLIDEGLIREDGERKSKGAGRKPVLLRFNPGARLVIGIVISSKQITGIIANLANQVLNRRTALTYGHLELHQLQSLIEELLEDNPRYRRRLGAICVGNGTGENLDALVEQLNQDYSMPVTLAERVILTATAEAELGSMAEQDSFILFYLGPRSYTCLYLNGYAHLGRLGLQSAEHPLAEQVNDSGLVHVFEMLSVENDPRHHPKSIPARLIFEAARQYDPVARQSVMTVVATLADAAICVSNALNITHVVIAGPWVNSADVLIPALQEHIDRISQAAPSLSAAKLGDDAALLGAVCSAVKMVDVTF